MVAVAGGAYPFGTDSGLEIRNPRSTEYFEPASARWTDGTDLGSAREKATATLLHDGSVLVAGGSIVEPGGFRARVLSSAERLWVAAKVRVPRRR